MIHASILPVPGSNLGPGGASPQDGLRGGSATEVSNKSHVVKLYKFLLAPSRVPIPWCPRESPCVSLAVPPHCLWITLNSPRSCGPKRSNKPLILYVQYVQFCSKKATTAAAYPPAANGIVERNDTYINTEYNNNNND